MLEYDAPTIIDVKYTNHGYFPSNVNKFVQIVQEQSLLYPLSFAILQLHQQVAAFLQTIGSRDMVLQQLRFRSEERRVGKECRAWWLWASCRERGTDVLTSS